MQCERREALRRCSEMPIGYFIFHATLHRTYLAVEGFWHSRRCRIVPTVAILPIFSKKQTKKYTGPEPGFTRDPTVHSEHQETRHAAAAEAAGAPSPQRCLHHHLPGYIVLLTGTRKCATSALSLMALTAFFNSRFSLPNGSVGGSRPSSSKDRGTGVGCACVCFRIKDSHSMRQGGGGGGGVVYYRAWWGLGVTFVVEWTEASYCLTHIFATTFVGPE